MAHCGEDSNMFRLQRCTLNVAYGRVFDLRSYFNSGNFNSSSYTARRIAARGQPMIQHSCHIVQRLHTATPTPLQPQFVFDCVWNVMGHAQKPDFVFRRNGRVHLNRRGRQFSRLLAAEVCASAVIMLDTPCSEVVWKVLVTHSIRQFPLHFPSLRHRVPSHFDWTLRPTDTVFY
jgi:hypothetical protein